MVPARTAEPQPTLCQPRPAGSLLPQQHHATPCNAQCLHLAYLILYKPASHPASCPAPHQNWSRGASCMVKAASLTRPGLWTAK